MGKDDETLPITFYEKKIELEGLSLDMLKIRANISSYKSEIKRLNEVKNYLLYSGDSNNYIPNRLASLEDSLSDTRVQLRREIGIQTSFEVRTKELRDKLT